jgi:hypothetical protein
VTYPGEVWLQEKWMLYSTGPSWVNARLHSMVEQPFHLNIKKSSRSQKLQFMAYIDFSVRLTSFLKPTYTHVHIYTVPLKLWYILTYQGWILWDSVQAIIKGDIGKFKPLWRIKCHFKKLVTNLIRLLRKSKTNYVCIWLTKWHQNPFTYIRTHLTLIRFSVLYSPKWEY